MFEKKPILVSLLCAASACASHADQTMERSHPAASSAGTASTTALPDASSPANREVSQLPSVAPEVLDPSLRVDVQNSSGVVVDVVKVQCAGACSDVIAVARGGNPPYAFTWEDGSTQAARRLCPAAESSYTVQVTDTEIATDEFKHDMLTAETTVKAQVLECSSDAGMCGLAALPSSGTYEGGLGCAPGEQVELPTADGGTQLATLTLSLTLDPNQAEQSGTLSFTWVVAGAIAIEATFQGILDCDSGELHATFQGIWGLPLNGALLESGKVWGDLTAVGVPSSPGLITGTLNYESSAGPGGGPDAGAPYPTIEIPGVMMYQGGGGKCTGTYSASLQP